MLRQFDPTARRNVEECQQASVDIKTELPLAVQCKCLKRWSMTPHAILKQAKDGAPEGKIPLGMVKIDRLEPVVILTLKDFLKLFEVTNGKD